MQTASLVQNRMLQKPDLHLVVLALELAPFSICFWTVLMATIKTAYPVKTR